MKEPWIVDDLRNLLTKRKAAGRMAKRAEAAKQKADAAKEEFEQACRDVAHTHGPDNGNRYVTMPDGTLIQISRSFCWFHDYEEIT